MLMVSDLLELAMGRAEASEVAARAPSRFQPTASVPFVVVWNVCRHCNMTCPHCYAAAGPRPSPNDLSTDEGMQLIDALATAGVRFLIFSGGEPLLRTDLFELMAHARARGLSPQLSTNGVLIDAAVAERLRSVGVGYVGVSIDGLPSFNDPYRGLEGGFARALEGLRHAGRAGMRTGLRMTLTRRNADQLEDMVAIARDAPVDRFYVSHLVYAGRGRRLIGDDLHPEEGRRRLHDLFGLAEQLLREGAPMRIVTGGNDSDGPALHLWAVQRYGPRAGRSVWEALAKRGGNSAGERVLCIDAQGRVHPDQFWQGLTLGNVRTDRFEDILAHPRLQQLRQRELYLRGRCATCPHVPLCRGSHRERAIAASGDVWGPDPACVLTDSEVAATCEEAWA
jgi:Fe-coproporphyrin III synthase